MKNITKAKRMLAILASMTLISLSSCSDSEFAAGGGQQVQKAGVKNPGKNPNLNPPVETGNPNDPNPNRPLTVDSGGKILLLKDVFIGAIEYQGNQCPGGGACGDENVQRAIDGLDFRNIDQTTTLQPASAKDDIRPYAGKAVMTGFGSGSLWGARKATVKASHEVIYFSNDVSQANTCPNNRVPIGKPKVARTSQMGLFLCAKLDPRVTLGDPTTHDAGIWTYGVYKECPAGRVVVGASFNGVNKPWFIHCAPLNVKQN